MAKSDWTRAVRAKPQRYNLHPDDGKLMPTDAEGLAKIANNRGKALTKKLTKAVANNKMKGSK